MEFVGVAFERLRRTDVDEAPVVLDDPDRLPFEQGWQQIVLHRAGMHGHGGERLMGESVDTRVDQALATLPLFPQGALG